MTLKGICNGLVRRSGTLEIIALFCSPQTLLQPLCQLLDTWQEHEDQGTSNGAEHDWMLILDRRESASIR